MIDLTLSTGHIVKRFGTSEIWELSLPCPFQQHKVFRVVVDSRPIRDGLMMGIISAYPTFD
jgi:hypothetical protein